MAHVVVVGAGILGLATAARLAARGDDVTVLEKEAAVAEHQSGRSSGVVHSGAYCTPGSLKARLTTAGNASLTRFALERGIPVETCGKLVVATSPAELPRLAALARQGRANGVLLTELSAAEAHEIEPHVRCVAALLVESTAIVDYHRVCDVLASDLLGAGGTLRLGRTVVGVRQTPHAVVVEHADADDGSIEEVSADLLVACAGLQADRVAAACGLTPTVRVAPFRGDFYRLAPEAAQLVRGLVYPVPDPASPFLGVHITRMVYGGVHAGPSAVLSLAREGYRRRDVHARDVLDEVGWPGMWRLAARNAGTVAFELARSFSRRLFAASLARLVPAIGPEDLVPGAAGVRAQAVGRDGHLVDDFLVQTAPRQVHVLNAPSPAATAALEIAGHLERQADRALVRV